MPRNNGNAVKGVGKFEVDHRGLSEDDCIWDCEFNSKRVLVRGMESVRKVEKN